MFFMSLFISEGFPNNISNNLVESTDPATETPWFFKKSPNSSNDI